MSLKPLQKKGKFSIEDKNAEKKVAYVDIIFNINNDKGLLSTHKIECDVIWTDYERLKKALKLTNETIRKYFKKFWKSIWKPIFDTIDKTRDTVDDDEEPLSVELEPAQFDKLMLSLPDFFNSDKNNTNADVTNDDVTLLEILNMSDKFSSDSAAFEECWMFPSTNDGVCYLQVGNDSTDHEIECIVGQGPYNAPLNTKGSSTGLIFDKYEQGERHFNIFVEIYIDSNPMGLEDAYELAVYHNMLQRCIPLFWDSIRPPLSKEEFEEKFPDRVYVPQKFPNRLYIPTRLVVESVYTPWHSNTIPKLTVKALNNNRAQESMKIVTNRLRGAKQFGDVIPDNVPAEKQLRNPDLSNLIQQFAKGKRVAKGKQIAKGKRKCTKEKRFFA